jgi:hypothetical protein
MLSNTKFEYTWLSPRGPGNRPLRSHHVLVRDLTRGPSIPFGGRYRSRYLQDIIHLY